MTLEGSSQQPSDVSVGHTKAVNYIYISFLKLKNKSCQILLFLPYLYIIFIYLDFDTHSRDV